MFSATMDDKIKNTCRNFMQNQNEIFIDDTKLVLDGLLQYYVQLEETQKNKKLIDLLDTLEFNQIVIFVKSVLRAKALNRLLCEQKFPSMAIHGEFSQKQRESLFQKFKNVEARILVTTDVFARGVDVERVNIVVNYDMPYDSDTYLHKVGRAGRFGTKGLTITFSSSDEDNTLLKKIQERFLVKIEPLPESIKS